MRCSAILSLIALAAATMPVGAQAAAEKTGAGLDAAVHASWTRVPLREWIARVSSIAGRPVVLDRRIDPEILVTLTARGETLRELLANVATKADAAVEELESSVRIVPASVAGMATRADVDRRVRVAKTPQETRRRLIAAEPWVWPAASRPRDLVADLATKAGLTIEGLDKIPHDHFPAADLTKLTVAERLDLVLAHFDRRVAWTGAGAGHIVAIDAELLTTVADHPEQPLTRKPAAKARTAKVRDEFTLRLEAPLDQALQAIGSQLGLEIEIDRDSLVARGIALGEIARADVSKVSREELFDAILHPLGLSWQLDGTRLRVFAPRP